MAAKMTGTDLRMKRIALEMSVEKLLHDFWLETGCTVIGVEVADVPGIPEVNITII